MTRKQNTAGGCGRPPARSPVEPPGRFLPSRTVPRASWLRRRVLRLASGLAGDPTTATTTALLAGGPAAPPHPPGRPKRRWHHRVWAPPAAPARPATAPTGPRDQASPLGPDQVFPDGRPSLSRASRLTP